MATLRGERVDRPPVCFYELNGLDENTESADPYNIFSDPSWQPLLQLTREKTDRIVMRGIPFRDASAEPMSELTTVETEERDGELITRVTIRAGNRILTGRTKRQAAINTVWTEEHLLKSVEDVKAYLEIPAPPFGGTPDPSHAQATEEALGDTGIVMVDSPDPLVMAASLFEMGEYTIFALTEPKLFRRLLDRFAETLYPRVEAIAAAFPGHLWRIYGPEYASPPYLPPYLFREYVAAYDHPLVESIQRYGGYARIHSHGRLRAILDDIAGMKPDGLDPIEPPPQGDMQLCEVWEKMGRETVLFGNLEISDIETLPTPLFVVKVKRALSEGVREGGRGFVLMPSACPLGRTLPALTLCNYEAIIDQVERFSA
jgi:hypothetical protein